MKSEGCRGRCTFKKEGNNVPHRNRPLGRRNRDFPRRAGVISSKVMTPSRNDEGWWWMQLPRLDTCMRECRTPVVSWRSRRQTNICSIGFAKSWPFSKHTHSGRLVHSLYRIVNLKIVFLLHSTRFSFKTVLWSCQKRSALTCLCGRRNDKVARRSHQSSPGR